MSDAADPLRAATAKDSELIQYATEIKGRAEWRCGELLAATPRNAGGRPVDLTVRHEYPLHTLRGFHPTIEELGLTHNESSRYQQLAAIPADPLRSAALELLERMRSACENAHSEAIVRRVVNPLVRRKSRNSGPGRGLGGAFPRAPGGIESLAERPGNRHGASVCTPAK